MAQRAVSPKPSQALIALGSNLGDSYTILESALEALNQTSEIRVEARSQWYKTKPIGPPQPDYLNGCALLQTTLTPHSLLAALFTVETQFGRERRERWGARTLDLDLLLFDDVILQTPDLQVPHPRMHERAFVLVPLAEIAPDWIEPRLQRSVLELAGAINASDVQKFSP